MRAVMLDVPEALLVERRRLDLDRLDEMWEGELHMVPPPSFAHQDLASWLVAHWLPLARDRGLRVTQDTGLFDPMVADFSSYRVPDVAVSRPAHTSKRGIEGRAELVVEICSPGDESHQKLAFYERVGVQELLIIELDMPLCHWGRRNGVLIELTGDRQGSGVLEALPVTIRRTSSTTLEMNGTFGTTMFGSAGL